MRLLLMEKTRRDALSLFVLTVLALGTDCGDLSLSFLGLLKTNLAKFYAIPNAYED